MQWRDVWKSPTCGPPCAGNQLICVHFVAFLTCGLTLASVEVAESVDPEGGIKFKAGATKADAQAGSAGGAKPAV